MAQIGTIRLQTQSSGTVSVPVFDTGDSGSSVYEFVRVQTAGGNGFIPVVDPADASYPYLRVQSQNQGVVAVHNEASLQADELVSLWEFEQDVTDSVGNNDGTNNGATFTSDHQIGDYAIATDGSNDFIEFGNITEIGGVSQSSISIWAKMNDYGKRLKIMGYYESYRDGHFIQTGNSTTDAFFVRVENDGTRCQLNNVDSFNTGEWYHLVLTFNSGSIVFYKNGSEVGSEGGGPSTTPRLDNWVIGGTDGNEVDTDPLDGVFDDARIYDKELSSTEVSNLYNTGSI